MNQEFPVGASHKLASITSLPFVHTARRYYRLSVLVRSSDCRVIVASPLLPRREDDQTVALRGSKSRNKVSVGEPAEGSLKVSPSHNANFNLNPRVTCVYVSLGLLACLRSVVKLLLTGVATRSAPCPMTAPALG